MTERAYTVRELDALRECCTNRFVWGAYDGHPQFVTMGRSCPVGELTAAVEEMVRTHMLAGHTAEDLLASAAYEGGAGNQSGGGAA